MIKSTILVVEDDTEDCELIVAALRKTNIQNEIRCFDSGDKALDYLKSTNDQPLLIISDINMPRMTGIDLKRSINNNETLKAKRIPFVFLSTSAEYGNLRTAYNLCIQGYFKKPNDFSEFDSLIGSIMKYWSQNSFVSHGIN